jgi:hypothetical protein
MIWFTTLTQKLQKKSGFSQQHRFIYIYMYKGTTQKGLLDQDERDTSEKKWALKLDFEEPKLQFFATLGVFNNEDLGF